MVTFKAEVYAHQKRADGTYNIKIRVIHNKKKKYIPTSFYATKEDLTRGTLNIKSRKYIDATNAIIKRYRDVCDEIGEDIKSMSIEQVVDAITRQRNKSFDLDIVSYARAHIQNLKSSGHSGNASTYSIAVNSLVRFVGREIVSIHEITPAFLNDWMKWIADNPSRISSNYNNGRRAQILYLSQLRAIYNRAKKEFNEEEIGLVRIPFSPFSKVEIPRMYTTRKRAISTSQLVSIISMDDTSSYHFGVNRFNLAKDVFLLSFYLIGMNAVDLYTCSDFKDGRITYRRTKTKNRRLDGAEMSVRLETEAELLFEKYRDKTGQRVFNFYKMYSSVDSFTAALNKGLKKVGSLIGVQDLEFYAARHTWATIALNEVGIDKYTIHTSLNHVDSEMRVTDIYIAKSWDVVDTANRRVLDYLNKQMSVCE